MKKKEDIMYGIVDLDPKRCVRNGGIFMTIEGRQQPLGNLRQIVVRGTSVENIMNKLNPHEIICITFHTVGMLNMRFYEKER